MSTAATVLARQLAAAQHKDAMPRLQAARGPTRIGLCVALLFCVALILVAVPVLQSANATTVVDAKNSTTPMPPAALRFAGAYRSGAQQLDEASAAEWVRVLGWLVERERASR